MKLTIKKKIIMTLGILICLSVIALGFSSYYRAKRVIRQEMERNNEQTIINVKDFYLVKFMRDMEYVVDSWSKDPRIQAYENAPGQPKMVHSIPENFEGVAEAWRGYLLGNPDIAWMYLGVESDGSILLEPLDPTMPEDYDCRERYWYRETVRQGDKPFWTQPYVDAGESGETIVTVSKAVRKDGRLVGVVGMDIKLRKFSQLIKGIHSSHDGYLMLMGSNGEVYAHPDDAMLTRNLSDVGWVQRILESDSGTAYFEENEQQYVYSYLTVPETGWKLVGVRPVDMAAMVKETRSWTLDSAILAALLITVSAVLITQMMLKPLGNMMQTINHISGGGLEARMEIRSNDEFGVLSENFNRMLDRLGDLMRERDAHVAALTASNTESQVQKERIIALYEETESMNEELTELLAEVRNGYLTTVRALANAIEASDTYTRGHCDRVRHYAMKLGCELGLSEEALGDLEFSSMLHDIGKIGIPYTILNKPDRLTDEEMAMIRKHPVIGAEILADIPFLENCRTILLQHHEWVNGGGYPDGLRRDEIHPLARILSIVDAYDAMTSNRPYRSAPLPVGMAMLELEKGRGTQFDSEMVVAFQRVIASELNQISFFEDRTGV